MSSHREAPEISKDPVAVYPTLTAGQWNLWHPDAGIAMTVDISDGAVTEAHWAAR